MMYAAIALVIFCVGFVAGTLWATRDYCASYYAAWDERIKVIKYLQETQTLHEKNLKEKIKPVASKHHSDACRWAASAIRNGEHLIPLENY